MADAIASLQFIVIDANDPDRLAGFWGPLLGTDVGTRVGEDDYVLLDPPNEGAPSIAFQRVPEAHTSKNRVHLDLMVPDLPVAAAKVAELGGSILGDPQELEGCHWQNLADPEGNEFDIALSTE